MEVPCTADAACLYSTSRERQHGSRPARRVSPLAEPRGRPGFCFFKLPNSFIRDAFPSLRPHAIRVLHAVVSRIDFDNRVRISAAALAQACALTLRQTRYALASLIRCDSIVREGHTLRLGSALLDESRGWVRWPTEAAMEDVMLEDVQRLTGSEMKLLAVLQCLIRQRPGWWGIKTDTLIRVVSVTEPTFRLARAKLKHYGLIDFRARPRHPTEYQLAARVLSQPPLFRIDVTDADSFASADRLKEHPHILRTTPQLDKRTGYLMFNTASGWRTAHRVVMEHALGRVLDNEEHVHHINGVKTDNRVENLLVMSAAEHVALHARERHQTLKKPAVSSRGESVQTRRTNSGESVQTRRDNTKTQTQTQTSSESSLQDRSLRELRPASGRRPPPRTPPRPLSPPRPPATPPSPARRSGTPPADDAARVSAAVQHTTLHSALRLLGVSVVTPQSDFGRRVCASLRARVREGFTVAQLLTVVRWAACEYAAATQRGDVRFVRKLRKLLYLWGSEFPQLLAEASDAPVAAECVAAAAAAAAQQRPMTASQQQQRVARGVYAIVDPAERAAWEHAIAENMAEGVRRLDARVAAAERGERDVDDSGVVIRGLALGDGCPAFADDDDGRRQRRR